MTSRVVWVTVKATNTVAYHYEANCCLHSRSLRARIPTTEEAAQRVNLRPCLQCTSKTRLVRNAAH